MKAQDSRALVGGLALVAILTGGAAILAEVMGTAFTYQGRLTDANGPANGAYDFEFTLYDSNSGPNVVGSTVTEPNVTVANGVFTADPNFGREIFNGDALWLEIDVRPAGVGGYTTLSPRQRLRPAPYALYARGTIPVYNVRDFGAVGDGDANDTAAIQAALDTAPPGATVWFPSPPAYYLVDGSLSVARPMTLLGDRAELRFETPNNVPLLKVRADDVSIRGLKLVGRQFVSNEAGEKGIDAQGSSASDPISGLRVENNEIRSFGEDAIYLRYVDNFQVSGNRIENINYAGVRVDSGRVGVIKDNRICNVVITAPDLGWGILLSRTGTDSLVTDPRCSDIVVSGNLVEEVPNWEAYDTHGGQRISFVGNIARHTKIGINVGPAGANEQSLFAPLDVMIAGNILDSNVADGSAGVGIQFSGACTSGPCVEYATGVVSSNVVRGYGDHTSANSGAIILHSTRGAQVAANTLIEPSPVGINLPSNNWGATVSGNTIIDAWSNDPNLATSRGIVVGSVNNTVHIGDNTIGRGGKIATFKCQQGVRLSIGPNSPDPNDISLGVNSARGVDIPLVNAWAGLTRLANVEFDTSSDTPVATFKNGDSNGAGVLIQAGDGDPNADPNFTTNYVILDVQTWGGDQPLSSERQRPRRHRDVRPVPSVGGRDGHDQWQRCSRDGRRHLDERIGPRLEEGIRARGSEADPRQGRPFADHPMAVQGRAGQDSPHRPDGAGFPCRLPLGWQR